MTSLKDARKSYGSTHSNCLLFATVLCSDSLCLLYEEAFTGFTVLIHMAKSRQHLYMAMSLQKDQEVLKAFEGGAY